MRKKGHVSLSPHISTKRLLNAFALLLKLSNLNQFLCLMNDIANSIIDFSIYLDVFSLRRSFFPACNII